MKDNDHSSFKLLYLVDNHYFPFLHPEQEKRIGCRRSPIIPRFLHLFLWSVVKLPIIFLFLLFHISNTFLFHMTWNTASLVSHVLSILLTHHCSFTTLVKFHMEIINQSWVTEFRPALPFPFPQRNESHVNGEGGGGNGPNLHVSRLLVFGRRQWRGG